MFLSMDIPFEYSIEHATFGLLNIMFKFSARIFYRDFQALQLIILVVFGAVD